MASKRRMRRKACVGKVRHANAESARSALRALLRARGYAQMNVYRCGFCNGFHVGHRPRP